MSGVIRRQLNSDHEVRSHYIAQRLRSRDEKDRHTLETAAMRVARSLAKQDRAERLQMPVYRASGSLRTVMTRVYLVNRQPTRNRTRYYVSGNGTLYKKGLFDPALSSVDVRTLSAADREDLAGVLGTTLLPVD
jgi:hypothetical protein